MVRHHDIADHDELIPLPYSFEHFQQQVAAAATGKPRLSAIATAVDEVQMIGAIVASRMLVHSPYCTLSCAKTM